jgi:hypothetical protein
MLELTTELPIGLSVFCLFLGAAYAFVLYRNHTFEGRPWLPKVMAFLRLVVVSVLAFFLLEPFVSTLLIDKEKPIVVISMDNSESVVANADSTYYQQAFVAELNALQEGLSENHEVDFFSFGGESQADGTIDFKEKQTDISDFFQNLSDVYSHRNVAAVILASDGLYNSGQNPLYSAYPFQAPLHTIALGDTTPQKDVEISHVFHNELAFLGNEFPVNVSVQTAYCKGEKTQLSVWEGSTLLHQEEVLIEQDQQLFHYHFKLTADEVGVHQYNIRLKAISEEQNTGNNQQSVFVDVLESRQRILLLSEMAHPDIAAISAAIQQNDNYELEHQLVFDFNGDYTPYSLLIAYQTTVDNEQIPVWHLWGSNTSSQNLDWLSFTPYKGGLSEVLSTTQSFSLFTLSEEWEKWSQQLPPLYAPFGDYTFDGTHQSLFVQSERGVETNKPILTFNREEHYREAVWAGEGLWKWRLFEYSKNQNHNLFDELINKTVQFLAVKEDKRLFRVRAPRKVLENETILVKADLYNANYELVNDVEASFLLVDEAGNEFPYTFNKQGNAYQLQLSNLEQGSYQYAARVLHAGQEHIREGQLVVMPLQLEQLHTQANHQLLYKLSNNQGGKMYYPAGLTNLQVDVEQLDSPTVTYSREQLSELLHSKWIFFLLLVLLSLEWFLRKRNGSV